MQIIWSVWDVNAPDSPESRFAAELSLNQRYTCNHPGLLPELSSSRGDEMPAGAFRGQVECLCCCR